MAILPILIFGDPRLREKAQPVQEVGEAERRLIDDMVETMHAAPGIGLAATQVGVDKRIAVVDVSAGEDPQALLVLVNPRISEIAGEATEEEGCLSVPDVFVPLRRPQSLQLQALDREGRPYELRAEGLVARAICHELDHLDGVLIVDSLSSLKRGLIRRRLTKRQEAAATRA
jgi:peptide deformylase